MEPTPKKAKPVDEEIEDILSILEGRKAEPEPIVEEVMAKAPKLEATDWEDLGDGIKRKLVPYSEHFKKNEHFPDHLVPIFVGYNTLSVPEVYVPPTKEFEQFSFAISLGLKANIVGPTGSGKDLMSEYYAAKLRF